MLRPHLEPISLVKVLEGLRLTPQQANKLANLKIGGTTPLLSLEDRPGIYTVVSLIEQLGWDKGIAYIEREIATKSELPVSQVVKNLVLRSPLLAKSENRLYLDMDKYRRKASSAKGLHTCRVCGSKETISVQKQLRSADEPMTTIITCVACGKTWRE
jgi:DNA-directed RNA polymerase subunit M/transcription elongation factor TFIIS